MAATTADEARQRWGRTIRDARREADLTQAELARRADTSQDQVSFAERGRAGADMYLRLAAALGVTLVFDPEPAE
jgi:transcriptional regulator with XRE-family HTH domain